MAKESGGLGGSSSAGGEELCDSTQASLPLWTSNSLICKRRGLSQMPFKVASAQHGSTCSFLRSKWGILSAAEISLKPSLTLAEGESGLIHVLPFRN